jgi:hypothetical protein
MGAPGEDLLFGLLALGLLPLIALRLWRGLRDGRLPLYRSYVAREAGQGKFAFLFALHALSFLLIAGIAADLLLNLGIREKL